MQTKTFDELTSGELYRILRARIAVFCVEQNCPYQDLDNADADALHVFQCDAAGEVQAYARILAPDAPGADASIGRVLTALPARGSGLGECLMRQCMDEIRRRYPDSAVCISAQSYLHRFYTRLGFRNTGHFYLEDDIPHQRMRWQPG